MAVYDDYLTRAILDYTNAEIVRRNMSVYRFAKDVPQTRQAVWAKLRGDACLTVWDLAHWSQALGMTPQALVVNALASAQNQ